MTAEELLMMSDDVETYIADDALVIDPESRTILTPAKGLILGVESDEEAERVHFVCPRFVGDNIDLSELQIRTIYQNANGEKDFRICTDVSVDGDNIRFSWLLSRKVTRYKGKVKFIVCAIRSKADGTIRNEWNTTLAEGISLEGLEVDSPEEEFEEPKDIVLQLLGMLDEKATEIMKEIDKYLEKLKIDNNLDVNSENAIQNKVVAKQFNQLSEDIADQEKQIEKNIYIDALGLKRITKSGNVIVIDEEIKNVHINLVPIEIYHTNRFDFNTMPLTVNSYNSYHNLTRENNGLKIVRELLSSQSYIYQTSEYVAEFDGNLWFSCDTKAKNIEDVMIKIKVNDNGIESLYGVGKLYCCIPVSKNDVVKVLFYSCLGNNTTDNEIYYSNIMLQYETLTDFVNYTQTDNNNIFIEKDLVLDGVNYGKSSDWTTTNAVNGKYYYKIPKIEDMLVETYPQSDHEIGNWYSNFNQISCLDGQHGSSDGLFMFKNGIIGIYLDNIQSKSDLETYLKSNPITITYKYGYSVNGKLEDVKIGDILVSNEDINMTGYVKDNATGKTINHVAFGDSITGMFGYATSYPEMITRMSNDINSINVGFSGTQVTDHSNANYKAFSFNKLVDSIISGDWTLQDNAAANISSAYYVEHLETLKNIDFKNIDYVSLFYGTNDWGSSVRLETMKTVYVESITKLLTAFPHLKLIVISPYWRAITKGKDSNVDANSNNEYLYDFADAIEELAKKNFNCPTINLYHTLGANVITNRYFTQDGTHPTFRTREIIAKDLIKLMV